MRPYIVDDLGLRRSVSPSLNPSGPSPITYFAFPALLPQSQRTDHIHDAALDFEIAVHLPNPSRGTSL